MPQWVRLPVKSYSFCTLLVSVHLPISAGGGLGLPSAESTFYCRSDLRGLIFAHRDNYPWLSLEGEFAKKFREMMFNFHQPHLIQPHRRKEKKGKRRRKMVLCGPTVTLLLLLSGSWHQPPEHNRWVVLVPIPPRAADLHEQGPQGIKGGPSESLSHTPSSSALCALVSACA